MRYSSKTKKIMWWVFGLSIIIILLIWWLGLLSQPVDLVAEHATQKLPVTAEGVAQVAEACDLGEPEVETWTQLLDIYPGKTLCIVNAMAQLDTL